MIDVLLAGGWPLGPVTVDTVLGGLSVLSLVIALIYVAWLYFTRKSSLLLIEMAFIVEDGGEIAEKIRQVRKDHGLHSPGDRWTAVRELARGLRWCRYRAGGLWVREERHSALALAVDAAELGRHRRTLFEGVEDAKGKRCLVGLVFTIELPEFVSSGGLEEAKKQLAFLNDEGPFEIGHIEAYYGVLDEDDDDDELLEDLRTARIRLHASEYDRV